MSSSTDAVCIQAKCGKTKKEFYMMYYKSYDEKWVLTYGKKELDHQKRSNKNPVKVNLSPTRTGPQYKCPHCGEKHTFICWNCGQHTCYDGDSHEGRTVTCAHCGKSGVFTTKTNGDGGKDKDKNQSKRKEIIVYSVDGQ